MGSNSFGKYFCISTFGESHGLAMGVVVDGCPSGVPFCKKTIENFLHRRRPGFSGLVSQRKEPDEIKVLSGVFEEKTLGTPIAVISKNTNSKSEEYDKIKSNPRVGHADDLWKNKFKNVDHRGGGRASGRETLSRVIGGSFAKMFVNKLYPELIVKSFVSQIGPIFRFEEDLKNDEVKDLLTKAQQDGQSYGAVINISIDNCPALLGEPVFKKIKSELASAMMSVGATSGIEFGRGFSLDKGTSFHDSPNSKNYGGIRGGISTGDQIFFKVYFKPTSSILNVAKMGRHDPCVALRAAVVLEAMSFLVLADLILAQRMNNI